MKVKFLQDRSTVNYGPVKTGQIVTVSDADAEAFKAAGIAEETKPKKETK